MYVSLVTVSIDPTQQDAARANLESQVVPMVKQSPGVKWGVWLDPKAGTGMSMVGFDRQSATFAFPGATLGAMGAAASSRALGADADRATALRQAELDASYRSAAGLGFDELIDPRESRDALLGAMERVRSRRQEVPGPVARVAITP